MRGALGLRESLERTKRAKQEKRGSRVAKVLDRDLHAKEMRAARVDQAHERALLINEEVAA